VHSRRLLKQIRHVTNVSLCTDLAERLADLPRYVQRKRFATAQSA
jgi:hypothetical protein